MYGTTSRNRSFANRSVLFARSAAFGSTPYANGITTMNGLMRPAEARLSKIRFARTHLPATRKLRKSSQTYDRFMSKTTSGFAEPLSKDEWPVTGVEHREYCSKDRYIGGAKASARCGRCDITPSNAHKKRGDDFGAAHA